MVSMGSETENCSSFISVPFGYMSGLTLKNISKCLDAIYTLHQHAVSLASIFSCKNDVSLFKLPPNRHLSMWKTMFTPDYLKYSHVVLEM